MTRDLMKLFAAALLGGLLMTGAIWKLQAQQPSKPSLQPQVTAGTVPSEAAQPEPPAQPGQPRWRPAPGGQPGQPGQPGGPDWPAPQPPFMPMIERGIGPGETVMVSAGDALFILRGNTLMKFDGKTLELLKKAALPQPERPRPVVPPRPND